MERWEQCPRKPMDRCHEVPDPASVLRFAKYRIVYSKLTYRHYPVSRFLQITFVGVGDLIKKRTRDAEHRIDRYFVTPIHGLTSVRQPWSRLSNHSHGHSDRPALPSPGFSLMPGGLQYDTSRAAC